MSAEVNIFPLLISLVCFLPKSFQFNNLSWYEDCKVTVWIRITKSLFEKLTLTWFARSLASSLTPRTTRLRWLLSEVLDHDGGRVAFLATILSTRLSVQWGKAGQCSRIGQWTKPKCWNSISFRSASKRSNALYLKKRLGLVRFQFSLKRSLD